VEHMATFHEYHVAWIVDEDQQEATR